MLSSLPWLDLDANSISSAIPSELKMLSYLGNNSLFKGTATGTWNSAIVETLKHIVC